MAWRRIFVIFFVLIIGFLEWTHTVQAAPVNYQYVKWEIIKKKGVGACAGGSCVQASEFFLMLDGTPIPWEEGSVVTNPGGSNPPTEVPLNVVDSDSSTKWLDYNFNVEDENALSGSSTLIFNSGTGVSFDGYGFTTANDSEDRDPVSWNVYGSNDGLNWNLIVQVRNHPTTDVRFTEEMFSLEGDFAGGEGTSGSPYEISTCRQLQNMSLHPDAHFKLVNNILCDAFAVSMEDDTSLWDEGGFHPIADFSGTLDGQDYSIYGISSYSDQEGGIFKKIIGGTIRNLKLRDDTLSHIEGGGDWAVGSLAGYASGATIENVFSDMSIFSDGSDTGGIVGYMDNQIGDNTISSTTYSGTITVTGATNFPSEIGGVVGSMENVVGDEEVGGTDMTFNGTIIVDMPNSLLRYVGGIAGRLESSWVHDLTVGPNARIEINADEASYIGGAIGITQNMAGTLDNITVEDGATISFGTENDISSVDIIGGAVGMFGVSGSRINSAADIIIRRSDSVSSVGGLFGYFTNDNNVIATSSATGSLSIIALGTEGITNIGGFIGTADSNNTHLYDSYATGDVTVSSGAAISSVGGFIGSGSNSLVERSFSSGQVTLQAGSSIQYIGGFTGRLDTSTIRDTFASGSLNATSSDNTFEYGDRIGGYAGMLFGSYMFNSYSSGAVNLEAGSVGSYDFTAAGGFVGMLWAGDVNNSFTVSSTTFIGVDTSLAGSFAGQVVSNGVFANAAYYPRSTISCTPDGSEEGCLQVSGVNSFKASYSDLPFNSHSGRENSQKWSIYNSVWNTGGVWDAHYTQYPTLHGLPNPYGTDTGDTSVSYSVGTAADASSASAGPVTIGLDTTSSSLTHSAFVDFDNSLVGWWHFDGNSTNTASSSNSGTVTGTLIPTGGKFGGSMFFDAASYIDLTRPVEDSFTICAWVLTTNIGNNVYHWTTAPIFESETGGVAPDFGFGIDSNGHAAFGVGGNASNGADTTLNSTTFVHDGEWHHVCAVRSLTIDNSHISLYVDKDLEGEADTEAISLNSNGSAKIGVATDGGTTFNGLLDELMVFNQALDANEIASLFDNQSNTYVEKDFDVSGDGTYAFRGYAVDTLGKVASTTARSITINGSDEGGDVSFDGGDGSSDSPYEISTCEQLQYVANDLNAHYELVGNVDCSASSGWNDGTGFDPIGESPEHGFVGVLDGNNHTISHLTIDAENDDYLGLFALIDTEGVVRDLTLTDVSITGDDRIGGLAGQNYGSIESVNVSGSVSGDSRIGGLVGENNSYIAHASTTVTVIGSESVGGIAGENNDENTYVINSEAHGGVMGEEATGGLLGYNAGLVSSSYATGEVSSDIYLGGLVGYNDGLIKNSFARGDVTGLSNATDVYQGGLVGYNYGDVVRAYATGHLTIVGENYVGGLIGKNDGIIESSYWDTETSGISESAGDANPRSTFDMTKRVTYVDWGFGSGQPWEIDNTVNDGYPFLYMEANSEDWSLDTLLSTDGARSITQTSANLSGIITRFGSSDLVTEGFRVWIGDDESYPTLTFSQAGGEQSEFSMLATELRCGSNYLFEAFVETGDNEELHSPVSGSFVTSACDEENGEEENDEETLPVQTARLSSGRRNRIVDDNTATVQSLQQKLSELLLQLEHATKANLSIPSFGTQDLTIGSNGKEVTALQNFLINKGYDMPLGATGYFGPYTQAALAAYQKAHNITPALGFFGPKTRMAILQNQ